MGPARVAVTGTPGVGKSTLAPWLAQALDLPHIDVKEFAVANGYHDGFEEESQSYLLDLDAIYAALPERWLLDGHVAHEFEPAYSVVLRVEPKLLASRLRARGYAEPKVRANLEAEALDLILQEALAYGGIVIQIDATHRSPDAVRSRTLEVLQGLPTNHVVEPVDWSDALMEMDHGA